MRATTPGAPVSVCAQGGWMQRAQVLMGRDVTVQVWADDRSRGAAAMAAVLAEMQRIARVCDAQRPASELAMVNAAAAMQAVAVSDELFQLLARAQAFARLTGGAFDVCGGSTASAEGWRQLALDPVTRSLRLADAGVRLDLSGFAEAYGIDRGVALLQRQGIRHAIVSVGGDARLLGDRRGSPWMVMLRDPDAAGRVHARLPLRDVAVSTAAAGHGRQHPGTAAAGHGRQHPGLRSVTVIAPEAITAHALARAALGLGQGLGPDPALALVQAHAAAEAVLVDAEGHLRVSAGLQGLQPVDAPQSVS